MTELTIDRYRRFLSELRSCVSDRARAEREIAAFVQSDDEPSAFAFEETLRALDEDVQRQIAEADERHAIERRTLEDRFRSETAAAEAERNRVIDEIRRRVNDELARVEQEYEENRWMLSSLLDDDSENSPKRQYDALNDQLQQSRDRLAVRWDELKTLYGRATDLLEERRQRADATAEPSAAARNRREALEGFDAAEMAVRGGFERLRRQTLPRLFIGWLFVLLGLALWGGLFAAGYLLLDPQSLGLRGVTPAGHVLLSGAVGLGIAGVVLGTLWGIAASQTAAAFAPVRQGMADAQANHQSWLRFAKEELQRAEKQYRDGYQALVERRDRASQRFTTERDERTATLQAELDRGTREPNERLDLFLRDASVRLNQALLASELAHRRETTTLRTRLERERGRLTEEREQRIAERDAERRRLATEMAEHWFSCLGQLRAAAEESACESRNLFPIWPDILSPNWTPAEGIPSGVRIGDYEIDLARIPEGVPADPQLASEATTIRLPAVLPFPNSPSLVLNAPGAAIPESVEVLQVATLRLLTLLPPGKVRLTIIDPVGLGENFAAFMHLADYDELLISGRIWTEAGRIEKQLGDLTEHMENVFQKYLRDEFETIEEYNAHAGEVAEPYRVLVVANFPVGFSERAAQRLTSIATSGPRCGVYALVGVDTKQRLPHGFDPASLEAAATVFRWEEGEFVTDVAAPDRLTLRPDAPPSPPEFSAIVRRIGELSKDIRRVEVPFHRIAPTEDRYWTADSRRSVDCPLGRAGATKLQHLRLGTGTSQHVLVAGKTGSGKSTLLHVLVTNLALRYSPDDIEFYLIDFKKGVEFKTYATHRLPHARVIAIESDREFGVSVLERLDAILKQRGDLFRDAGVQDIAAFRDARPDEPMPRILLVVDEFQEFFTEDDRYAQTASLLLDRLVRQGRAFGIHVLLGSQTLGGAYSLARTTIGQMAVRIALQCGEADASLILSEDNAAARLLTRPGEAIYNDANGMVEGNSPFQVAWLGDDERDDRLERVGELARRRGLPPATPVVFEGNVAADPSRNAALVRRIEAISDGRKPEVPAGSAPSAWIGEAVAITGPTEVMFRRQSGANLLLVGQDPASATGILAACLVGLSADAATGEAGTSPFRLLSGGQPGHDDHWRAILGVLPPASSVVSPGEAAATVAELAAEVARRRGDPNAAAPPLFLLIDDLSRFRDLRRSDDDYGFGGFDRDREPSPAQRFAEILREGPAVGVHVIAWCDSYGNADRWLGRALLREFEMRVVFQMSGADSSNLIDSPAASRLGTHRALLYLDDRGTTEKFRPYGPLNEEWLRWVQEHLRPDTVNGSGRSHDLDEDLDIDQWVIV